MKISDLLQLSAVYQKIDAGTTEIPFNINRNSKIKPFDNRQIFQKATSSSVIKLENIKKMRNENCFTHLSCLDY